jgi:hypothetical protein
MLVILFFKAFSRPTTEDGIISYEAKIMKLIMCQNNELQ